MKSPSLNRILEKSPAGSLAALSVGAFFRGDTQELHRIFGAMPSHIKASRREFFIQHHARTENVLLWAVEYWRTVANTQTCLVAAISPGGSKQETSIATFLLNAYKAKQATLIEAMRHICADTGIDFEDVAAFAEVEARIDAMPIPDLVKKYREIFGTSGCP